VSNDPIVEVNQKMESYWTRITKFYNENKKTENARSLLSLQHRCADIQKDTARFCVIYTEIERRNQSGKNEDDKLHFLTSTYEF
jgi:hypothetical protein